MIYVRTKKNPPPGTRRATGEAPWHRLRKETARCVYTHCGRRFWRGHFAKVDDRFAGFVPALECGRCKAVDR